MPIERAKMVERPYRRSISISGASDWATIASLIETCKLNGVDRYAYLTDVIASHPQTQIDDLLPRAYAHEQRKAVV